MIIERADGVIHVDVNDTVPAYAILLEAEAEPLVLGDRDPEKIRRVLLSLPDAWRALLLHALESTAAEPDQ